MEPIVLASKSPRRQEILKKLNIPFQVNLPDYDEVNPEEVELEKIPEYHATKKVDMVAHSFPKSMEVPWILGADTLVFLDKKIYGKPHDCEEAIRFLHDFSGKTHKVLTALALYNGRLHFLSTRTVQTLVTFKKMSEEEIRWYAEQGEWHGVAGGYRIQDGASLFIEKIEGSASNIVGLPISALYDMLKEQGYLILT